jgi:hypothetical protein
MGRGTKEQRVNAGKFFSGTPKMFSNISEWTVNFQLYLKDYVYKRTEITFKQYFK